MASVAAVAVGVKLANQLGIAGAQRPAVGIDREAEDSQMLAVPFAQHPPVGALLVLPRRGTEAGADRVERIGEVGPARGRRAVGREGAGLAVPAGEGIVSRLDFLVAHPREVIVAGVERPDVIEAKPAPVAGAVEGRAAAGGRTEFARADAAGMVA